MSVDITQLQSYSGTNTFKNTGVYTTSITFSGSVASGAEGVFTSTITLTENQVFAFAIVKYLELAKKLAGGSTQVYQTITGYADMYVQTTSANLGASMEIIINGTSVTFRAVLFNGNVGLETITSTTFNIQYVTYTLSK